MAVGVGAQALGTNTTANGNFAVALGNNASAGHTNSVALGNGSVTTSANSVSIGAVGAERTLQNVAAGVLATDASNMQQLQATEDRLSNQAQAMESRLTAGLQNAEKTASRGVAIAMASTQSLPPLEPGETGVGVGLGNYNGQTALGLSVGKLLKNGVVLSMGIAHSGGKTGTRAGVAFKF